MKTYPKGHSVQSHMAANHLMESNNITLDYHYRIWDYLILFMGGTRAPFSIDVYEKETHKHMLHIANKEVLDIMADD